MTGRTTAARYRPGHDDELTFSDVIYVLAAFDHLGNAFVSDRKRLAIGIRPKQLRYQRIEVMQSDTCSQSGGHMIEDRQIVAIATGSNHRSDQGLSGAA